MPIKDKNVLRAEIEEKIEDNEQGRVSPEDIRSALLDIIDSNHVLSVDKNLVAANLSSIDVGNTYLGEESATKRGVEYNTSVGYFALRANDGDQNTAVGAYASACNIFGSGNTSLGYSALGSNFDGKNNVALGKHSLGRSKNGSFNVGIGHGAGYYIDDNDSYKFYLGSHDIDESGMCNHPDGIDGMAPLLYGDLLNGTLVVGSDDMHDQGALQVNGNITPVSNSGTDNLGSYDYPWNKAYVKGIDSNETFIESWRDFNPRQASTFNLGSEDKPWNHLHVDNLHVNSLADLTNVKYVHIEDSTFYDKQIHLASSGVDSNNNTMPYLTDEGVDGAGLVVRASGTDYLRSYSWTYKAPDLDWECPETENAYSRSAWLSNISVEIMDGNQLKTQRVMSSDSLALVGGGCYGFFIDEKVVLGTQGDKNAFDNEYYKPDYISYATGDYANFTVSRESGIFMEDNLLSQYDGSSSLTGFKRRYFDTDDSFFVLSSHAGTQTPTSEFVSMRDRSAFGFSDQPNFRPETLVNTKSSGDAIFRHTGEVSSRIQLSSPDNLFTNGAEMYYSNENSRFGILTKEGDTVRHALTVSGDLIGINQDPFATLTVGKDRNANAAISLQEGSGQLEDKEGWGTIYVRKISNPDTPNSVFYRNENGDEFDLLMSSGDKMAPDSVYYDDYGNTFVGYQSIEDRLNPTSQGYLSNNTTLGHRALADLYYGSNNIAIGPKAGEGIVYGQNNIFIGSEAGLVEDDLGQTFYNQFRLGHNDEDLLMSGQLPTPQDRGYVYVQSDLGIVSKDNLDRFRMGQLGGDTIFTKESSGNIYFRYFDDFASDPLVISESGIKTPRIEFNDGTYFDTSYGVKFEAGNAISFTPESGTDRRIIDVDFDKLDPSDEMYQDTYVMVQSSGENYKSSILNIARFVNPDNPEMFFDCGGGYNIVVSRNSDVDNSKNCNNLVGGFKGGHNIEGFTNSLILGSKAGEQATMQNPDLSIDIAAVFLGYNAGRQSHNADNSIFIGPSAGQHSEYCDNSIFIGNSAGQSSFSSKSIAMGDNTLVDVDGENNLEIVADHRPNNRLINGEMSNKFNVQGVIAGDHCSGRVSVGGGARVFPSAVLEVAAGFGDNETPLQQWFNGQGNLVAYMDQQGNLVLKGSIAQNNSYMGDTNLSPAAQLNPDICGNTNSTGNSSDPGNGGGTGNNDNPSTGYSISASSSSVTTGESVTMVVTRFGGTLGPMVLSLSSSDTSKATVPSSLTIPDGVSSSVFNVLTKNSGNVSISTIHQTLGSKVIPIVISSVVSTSSFTFVPNSSVISVGSSMYIYGSRSGGDISQPETLSISYSGRSSGPSTVTFAANQSQTSFLIEGTSAGLANITVGTIPVQFTVESVNNAPYFSVNPSMTPGDGPTGTTFTGNDGNIENGGLQSRSWLLNGSSIGTGLSVTVGQPGTLVYSVTAVNPSSGQTVTANSNGSVVYDIVDNTPYFLSNPTISPSNGTTATNFEGSESVGNGFVQSRSWRLNSSEIGSGVNVVSANPGNLTYTVTIVNNQGETVTATSSVATVVVQLDPVTLTIESTKPAFDYEDDRDIIVTRSGGDITQPLFVTLTVTSNDGHGNVGVMIPANQTQVIGTVQKLPTWHQDKDYGVVTLVGTTPGGSATSNSLEVRFEPKYWSIENGQPETERTYLKREW